MQQNVKAAAMSSYQEDDSSSAPSSKHNKPLQAGEEICFQEPMSSQCKIWAHPSHLPSCEGKPVVTVYTNS